MDTIIDVIIKLYFTLGSILPVTVRFIIFIDEIVLKELMLWYMKVIIILLGAIVYFVLVFFQISDTIVSHFMRGSEHSELYELIFLLAAYELSLHFLPRITQVLINKLIPYLKNKISGQEMTSSGI